jgi:hypothetical protein
MIGYRVTKYNPAYRDENGHFFAREWTSISDIANTAEGRLEYSSVEDAYVKAIRGFYEKSGSPRLQVVGLEKHGLSVREPFMSDSRDRLSRMPSDEVNDKDGLEDIVRLALREIIWCKLEFSSVFYVHFGYDFYAYVGGDRLEVPEDIPGSIFVEAMESPYAQE